jgi:hypothetical protein
VSRRHNTILRALKSIYIDARSYGSIFITRVASSLPSVPFRALLSYTLVVPPRTIQKYTKPNARLPTLNLSHSSHSHVLRNPNIFASRANNKLTSGQDFASGLAGYDILCCMQARCICLVARRALFSPAVFIRRMFRNVYLPSMRYLVC